MLSNSKTVKYADENLALPRIDENADEKTLKKVGFVKKDGYYICAKKLKDTRAFIIIEQDDGAGNLYSKALFVKKILDFYHISIVGILLVYDKMAQYDEAVLSQSVDVLCLHFSSRLGGNLIPNNNVYCGLCEYLISPYPTVSSEKMVQLQRIANESSLNCEMNEGKLKGREYFAFLTEIEQKLLYFAEKTAEFDKNNSTMSRITVENLTLPVVNNEYYLDLFSSVPKTCGKVEYTGRMGCALDKSSGIFIDVNINDENNVESLCSYVKTFVEDING